MKRNPENIQEAAIDTYGGIVVAHFYYGVYPTQRKSYEISLPYDEDRDRWTLRTA